jgi:hypothetical protein
MKPESQLQVNEPGVLVQCALLPQFLPGHSSTSVHVAAMPVVALPM